MKWLRHPSSIAQIRQVLLNLMRNAVEAHGGRIWADASPGGGTAFRFILIHARADEEK
jgi:two-component system sensor kinase FixL